jgi:hypothetical protein
MDESEELRVLEILAEHDGKWGWYQLERGLSMAGVGGVHVVRVVSSLCARGLLVVSGPLDSATARYALTTKGWEAVGRTPLQ